MNHFMKTVSLLMVMLICVLSGCKNQSGSNGTFEIGDKTFLLNGKPFIIKAAEIHYTRIPVEYWEHRIQMCKALGMNTICIYAFWNIHEQNRASSISADKTTLLHSAVWLRKTVCISCSVPARTFVPNGKWEACLGGY